MVECEKTKLQNINFKVIGTIATVMLITIACAGIIFLLFNHNFYGGIDLDRFRDLTEIPNLHHKSFLPIILVAFINLVLIYMFWVLMRKNGNMICKGIVYRGLVVLLCKFVAITAVFYGGWYLFVVTQVNGNLIEQVHYMNTMFQIGELILLITYIPLLVVLFYRKKST
ncbi:hypothetical protein RBG61_03400 [Paludicola sp. MB14-C6]|uniref:hypothetical protein n=1 Tax=Paludihabitans sp. MB14-C6 TaxID=3070656 RepID=UPI0027DD071F|nr:hypothetical protein [Paludicola sp. MB14-C6]WMJ23720.1 hypothetical protein RBG61_03400 [Paludicola sp. MB14-C6]